LIPDEHSKAGQGEEERRKQRLPIVVVVLEISQEIRNKNGKQMMRRHFYSF
jgi:hypothetical protein